MSYRNGAIHLSLCVLLLLLTKPLAFATDQTGHPAMPSLSADQIVARMVDANSRRAERLRNYTSLRHYSVEYRGFPSNLSASMDVEATYTAPSTKSFRILSESGSKLLVNRVLKKLLESEEEAARNPGQSALTPANYNFSLSGTDQVNGQPAYILHVDPRAESKFLYRGNIWVDASDFAVAKIEAEPAKDPSFWIKKTEIHHVYKKIGEFWLPQRNRSETSVRVGGKATLTIDYGEYRINTAT